MLGLVLVLAPLSWMMSSAAQVLVSYWSALADRSYRITVVTLLMLVWGAKVLFFFMVIFVTFLLDNGSYMHTIFLSQLLALLVRCNWQEVTFQMKAEWKSA